MTKNFVWLLFLYSCSNAFAQNAQQQINEQVWKPFIQAYNAYDTDAFMAVHSKNLVRAPIDSKSVRNFEQYRKQNEEGAKRATNQGSTRTIDLHFITRVSNDMQAYEIGIYKVTSTNNNGENKDYYGKFHVVLVKENGVWKILVDQDSSENNTISEKDFLAARALE